MLCRFIKEINVNRKASRQHWHTDCNQVNSNECCRTNINNDKRGHKQNKHVFVHIISLLLLTPSLLQSMIDIYDV